MALVVLRDPGVVPHPIRRRPALRARGPAMPTLRSPAVPPTPIVRTVVRPPVPAALRPPAPAQQTVSSAALAVGIVAAGGTSLSMVAANLLIGPRTDITNFRILALDAGSW